MNVVLIFGPLYLRCFFPPASFKIFFFSSFDFLNFDSDMAMCSCWFFSPSSFHLPPPPPHYPLGLILVFWICGLVSDINLEKFLLFIAVNTVSFFFKKCLFIWLHQVLVVACRIFAYSVRALC